MKNDLNRNDVIKYLSALSEKEFVELFYEVVEKSFTTSNKDEEGKFIIAEAYRENFENEWAPWQLELIALHSKKHYNSWVDYAPICQLGDCCNSKITGWAKHLICPICGEEVYAT